MQEAQETWVRSLGWEIPWGRAQQPTPVFLPGEARGERSLVGYSPWGCKESGMTEQAFMYPFAETFWEVTAFLQSVYGPRHQS